MASLYELTGAYAGLMAQLDYAETEEEAAAIWKTIDELEMPYTEKCEAYARRMQNKRAYAVGLRAEASRLKKLADAADADADRMQESIRQSMITLGVTDVPTTIGTWKTKVNPPSCEVVDIAKVPEEFRRPIEPPKIPYTVDKKKANDHFKLTGEIIPGLNIERKVSVSFK